MFRQLIRFGSVGGFATLAHISIGLTVQRAFSVSPQEANLVGFLVGVVVSYLGNAYFTFAVHPKSVRQMLRFALLSLVGLAASSATVWLIATHLELGFVAAMVAVGVIVPPLTFLAMRLWVFDSGAERASASSTDFVLCAVISVAVLTLMWGRMLNHDTAWYLIAARKWLDGAQLYVDLIEVNPPLNFYLTLPALGFAELFGISDTNGQYCVISLLYFFSLFWCSAIIRSQWGMPPGRGEIFLVGVGVAIILPALNNFAQREHILLIFLLPWLLCVASPRPLTRKERIFCAAFAAVGICLKPHFILFPLAVTVFQTFERRSLRPILFAENLTFLCVGFAYVGFVAAVHPAYLFQIVGIAIQVYGAYGAQFGEILSKISLEICLLALPAAVATASRYRNSMAALFMALSVAGLGSYLLQGTGFRYHAVPFVAFGLIACILIIVKSDRPGPIVIAAVLALAGLAGISIKRGFYENRNVAEISLVAEQLGEVDGLMVLSTYVSAGPPAAMALGTDWTSRYPANWLVPGAINSLSRTDCGIEVTTCARLERIAAKNRSDNIEDILEARPGLLILDRRSEYFASQGFDWEVFMNEDPAWQTVIVKYRKVAESDHFIYYFNGTLR
jgi:putative flippase GtrA